MGILKKKNDLVAADQDADRGEAFFHSLQKKKPAKKRRTVRMVTLVVALMFRAHSLMLPFTLLYLIAAERCDTREIFRRALVTALVLLLFIVPWSVRNYWLFHGFIPISRGSGSPLLEGCYQGVYYPSDEALQEAFGAFDCDEAGRQNHPEILGEDGELLSQGLYQYYRLLRDVELARLRLSGWWKLHPRDFIRANFYVKPRACLNYTWYYNPIFGVSWDMAHQARQLNFLFCALGLPLAFLLKKHRRSMGFLATTAVYFGDRYSQMVMAYRYVAADLALDLLAEPLRRLRRKWITGKGEIKRSRGS